MHLHLSKTSIQNPVCNKPMDEALKFIELTTPGYAILAQLELESGMSNAEFARARYCIYFSTLWSGQEKRSNSHGRILLLELTKKGHKIVLQAH